MPHSVADICGAIPTPLLLCDATGEVRYANPAAAPLLQTTPAEAVGRQLSAVLHLTRSSGDEGDVLQRLLDEAPTSVRAGVCTAGGAATRVEIRATPVSGDGPERTLVVAISPCEGGTGAAPGSYESIVEGVGSIILRLDLEGRVEYLNRFAQEFFGYRPEELLGRSVVGTIVPETDTAGRNLRSLLAAICADPDRFSSNTNQNVTRDGQRRWVAWTNRAVRDETGQAVAVICVGNDVTDQYNEAGRIRSDHDRLTSVFDALDQPVYVADMDTYEVLYANRALRITVGGEAVGQLCYRVLQGRDTPCPFCTNDAIRRLDGAPLQWEFHNEFLDRHYALTDRMIGWPDGRRVRFELAIDVTDRVRAVAELRAKNELIASVVTASPLAIITLDAQGRVTSWSPAAERLFGWTAEEAVGQALPIIPPEQAGLFGSVLAAVTSGNPFALHHVPCVRSDGSLLQTAVSAGPIRDEAGAVIGAVGLVADVTDRIAAEEELRESERRLATLMDNLPGMVYRCANDPDWTMEVVSQGCLALTGYSPVELLDRSVAYADIIHEEDRQAVWDTIQESLTADAPFELLYRIVTRSGEVRWVGERGVGIRDEEGNLQALEGFVSDVTAARQAQKALQESENRLRSIVDAAQDAIFMKDLQGRYTHANAAMELLFRRPVDAIVGGSDVELFGPQQAEGIRAIDARVFAGEVVEHSEHLVIFDRPYVFHTIRVPLRDAAGEVVGLCAIARDITERSQAEEAIRAQEERYRTFIEATGDLVFLKDEQLRYIITNRANAEFLGLPADQVIGKTDLELMPPEAAAACRESDLEAAHSSTTVLRQERVGDRAYEVRKFPVRLGPGKVGVGAYIRDITDARATEEERRASEARYRVLFVEARDAMIVSDEGTGIVTEANAKAQELLGRPGESIVGMHRTDLFCAERPPSEPQGGQHTTRAEVVTAQGRIVPVEATSSVIELVDGTRVVYDVFRDVTERRQAEIALRESEARYRSMFDNTGTATFTFGDDAVIAMCNANFEKLYGLPRDQIEGRMTWMEFAHRDDLQRMLGYHLARTEGSDAPSQYEFQFVDSVGHTRNVVIQIGVVPGTEWRIASLLDITDRKHAEDAERLAAVGQLAAGVAHDFNNLLASMAMRAEFTSLRSPDGPCQELVDTVLRATKRGAEIARNLMAFARPQAPSRELTYIEAPIEAALNVAARQLESAQVTVRRQFQPEPWRVHVDPGQMEQVFLNLFINASHAMPTGGTLTVRTSYSSDDEGRQGVAVEVVDTGTGIDPANLANIFKPFFTTKGRLGDTATPGTGLGLSVSKGIVESHGGTIEVHSSPGEGTVFTISLPAGGGRELPGTRRGTDLAARARDSLRREGSVLVAEDENELRELAVDVLRQRGFRVWGAANTQDAVDQLMQRPFDLVVTDLTMPGGGGREVAAFARALPEPPPVVVITGKLEVEVSQQLDHLGVAAHIHKPFSISQLYDVIDRVLHRPVDTPGEGGEPPA